MRKIKTLIRRQNQRGFSLIEVSIVMIILAFLLMPLFSFLNLQRQHDIKRKQEAKNNQLLAALSLYVRANGHYPCPADPTLSPGSTGFGVANCAAAGVAVHDTAGWTVSGGIWSSGTGSVVHVGAFPFVDTNLPYQDVVNRSGWQYAYAVTDAATTSLSNPGSIKIVDALGSPYVTQPAQFVLLNPGDDGKGAYTINGSQPISCVSGSGHGLDSENCTYDATFMDAPYAQLSDIYNSNYYDDTIVYTSASKESTLWVASENSGPSGGLLNITNRNEGNVAIGASVTPPPDKLTVNGDVLVQPDTGGTGGNISASKTVTSPSFYYSP